MGCRALQPRSDNIPPLLVTAFVQPRHIKLGLAGNEQDWLYAAYELDQLRETFADVAEILPK